MLVYIICSETSNISIHTDSVCEEQENVLLSCPEYNTPKSVVENGEWFSSAV